jgi:hypothetical protein
MLGLRTIRLLWLFVMLVITPVITLPWNTIGKTIAQQQEDDDSSSDDGEVAAAGAAWLQQGRPPRLPPPSLPVARTLIPLFAVHLDRPQAPALPLSAPQSTRVRLQI